MTCACHFSVDQSQTALRWSSSSLGGGGESMDELWRMVEAGGGVTSDAGGGASDRVGGASERVGRAYLRLGGASSKTIQEKSSGVGLADGSGLLVQGSTLAWASRSATRRNLTPRAAGRVGTMKNRNKNQSIRNYNARDSDELTTGEK